MSHENIAEDKVAKRRYLGIAGIKFEDIEIALEATVIEAANEHVAYEELWLRVLSEVTAENVASADLMATLQRVEDDGGEINVRVIALDDVLRAVNG